jgi:hypothetical protein
LQVYHKNRLNGKKYLWGTSSADSLTFAPTDAHRKPTPFLWCQGDVTVQEPDNSPEREVAYPEGGIL